MSRTPNKFINPSNAAEYAWPVNHSEEAEAGVARTITHGANTATTGLVRQQADDQPLTFQFAGTIFEEAQLEEMLVWYGLCKTQTIYFEKYNGDKFEVIITDFKPTEKRTIHNPKDFANAPLWYWGYTITMEVIRSLGSVWDGAVP